MTTMLSIDRFEIEAPASEVRAFLTDESNLPRWTANLTALPTTTAEELPSHDDRTGLSLIDSSRPDRIMASGWVGPYIGQLAVRVSPIDEATTALSAYVKLALPGRSTELVPTSGDAVRSAVVRDLDRIRDHVG